MREVESERDDLIAYLYEYEYTFIESLKEKIVSSLSVLHVPASREF